MPRYNLLGEIHLTISSTPTTIKYQETYPGILRNNLNVQKNNIDLVKYLMAFKNWSSKDYGNTKKCLQNDIKIKRIQKY